MPSPPPRQPPTHHLSKSHPSLSRHIKPKNPQIRKTLTPMAKLPASFATGDEVEVICQDEGFKGSLYEAHIVRCMHKLGRYSVEYETLMSDADPGANLRETVSAAHVRPRPPPRARLSFEIGEKVDAFHNDGWWVGEVAKVLEGGKNYAIRFPDDEPDELEFGPDGIRAHMDWIDGYWIMPKIPVKDKYFIPHNLCGIEPDAFRQLWNAISIAHESQIPILNGGSDENPCKSHDSAANLDSMNPGESTLQVQIESSQPCKKSENGEAIQDNLKLVNCLLFARSVKSPCTVETGFEVNTPAIEERTNSHLQPLGDYQYCSISPIDGGRLFNPDMVTNTPSNTVLGEISGEQIIPGNISQQSSQHIPPCIDDPSVMGEISTKLGVMGSLNQPKVASFDQSSNQSTEMDVRQSRNKVATAPSQGGKVPLHGDLRRYAARERGIIKRDRLRKERNTKTMVEKEATDLEQLEEKHDVVVEKCDSEKQAVRKRGRPWKVRIIDRKTSIEGSKPKQFESEEVAQEGEHTSEKVTIVDSSLSPEIQCQMDGDTLGDSFHVILRATGKQDAGEDDEPSNGDNCASQIEKPVQFSEDGKEAQYEAILLTGGQLAKGIEVENRTEAACESQGEEPHHEVSCLPVRDQVENEIGSEGEKIETGHTPNTSDSKKTNLPFAKMSSLWKVIESSEIFSMMPQNPHFLPLEQYSENFREGMAIGLMVTFANLVNKIRKLQINDSYNTLQDMMESLARLERYGFTVQHLRALVEDFQIIKANQKQLLDKRSALEGLILQRQNRKDALDERFTLIDKVVMELEKSLKCFRDERASIVKQREDNDHEIIKLQNDKRAVEESSLAAENSYLDALHSAQGSFANTC